MTWQEVCDDKSLQNLLYKIELDQWGRIVMSPADNRHARMQGRIVRLLEREVQLKPGEAFVECSVDTPLGTKVVDVVWASADFIRQFGDTTPYTVAPEICVEVKSLSNSSAEMAEKVALYLEQGAREVWICDQNGKLTFHDLCGIIQNSRLAPGCPAFV